MQKKTDFSIPSEGKPRFRSASRGARHISRYFHFAVMAALILLTATALIVAGNSSQFIPRLQEFSDPEGRFANFNAGGPTDTESNAFFQDMGTIVLGKIESGCVQKGQNVALMPNKVRINAFWIFEYLT